ncbi:MAG: three-Cys-motif partner protein TcmP [Bacteroidetes bacterium]|nr:MAG: three-Cys-motif partner protein TcmP [Bacteroidota bacterium]
MEQPKLDQIGYWTEIKLDIVRKYAAAYSTILFKQEQIRAHVYIDAFAGPGIHISKATGEFVPGSPLNALNVEPPFSQYHFIDLDGGRATALRSMATGRENVFVYEGDCNTILLSEVFPRCRYEDFRRALCLLDPYGLNVDWTVVRTAGTMRSIEIFYSFMIMDANMNVLHRNPEGLAPAQRERMDAVWGDDSWRRIAYPKSEGLFTEMEEKADNSVIAEAFRCRLRDVAGFKYVPEPLPMRNSKGAVVYYLYFASPNETGAKIVQDIFDKYRKRRGT